MSLTCHFTYHIILPLGSETYENKKVNKIFTFDYHIFNSFIPNIYKILGGNKYGNFKSWKPNKNIW